MTIFEQTLFLLRNRYADLLENLHIEEVRIGVHLTAVRLSDGSCGVASTVRRPPRPVDKSERDFGPFTPTKIKGMSVEALFGTAVHENFNRSLVIAAMNAVSDTPLFSGSYKVLENADPIDLLQLGPGKRAVIVGAFQSYIKRALASGADLQVLEMNENALQMAHRQYFVPAGEYPSVLPGAEAVIITGLTLANDTLDDLLAATSPSAEVIVTGPSSSFIPDVLYERNVKYLGGVRITDSALALDVAGEGGGGYHLFKYCGQKVCVVRG